MTADNNTCHRIKKFCWRSNPKSPGLLFWVFYTLEEQSFQQHTQSLRLLFGQGARTRCPWGEICVHCELFLCKSSALVLSLSEERGAAFCFPRFRTHRCRGTEVMKLAVECGRWVRKKRGTAPFRARRPRTRVSCWIVTMRSFWHNQIQRLVLFSAYERVFGGCGS